MATEYWGEVDWDSDGCSIEIDELFVLSSVSVGVADGTISRSSECLLLDFEDFLLLSANTGVVDGSIVAAGLMTLIDDSDIGFQLSYGQYPTVSDAYYDASVCVNSGLLGSLVTFFSTEKLPATGGNFDEYWGTINYCGNSTLIVFEYYTQNLLIGCINDICIIDGLFVIGSNANLNDGLFARIIGNDNNIDIVENVQSLNL